LLWMIPACEGTNIMNKKANTEMVTLTGIVMPSEWDGLGNVQAVHLSTYREEEFLVDRRGRGRELLDCLRKKVEVVGIVSGHVGQKNIRVKQYRFLTVEENGAEEA